jgi:predicted ATPase
VEAPAGPRRPPAYAHRPRRTGKTRLALQVATELAVEFTDGVAWVELATLSDPKLVPATIAHALDLGERAEEVVPTLKDHLRSRRLLLVLDNFEQCDRRSAAPG